MNIHFGDARAGIPGFAHSPAGKKNSNIHANARKNKKKSKKKRSTKTPTKKHKNTPQNTTRPPTPSPLIAPQKHRAYARNYTSRVKKNPNSHSPPRGMKPKKIPLCWAMPRWRRHEQNNRKLASLPKGRRPPACALPLDRALVSVGREWDAQMGSAQMGGSPPHSGSCTCGKSAEEVRNR